MDRPENVTRFCRLVNPGGSNSKNGIEKNVLAVRAGVSCRSPKSILRGNGALEYRFDNGAPSLLS